MTHTEEYKGHTIEIHVDNDPPNPADWDNLGKIAYLRRSRYALGYEAISDTEMEQLATKIKRGEYIGLPVFSYVHSGSTIRAAEANPFSCPWDSGQSGYVFVEKAKALKEYGRKKMSAKLRKQILAVLTAQVEEFDQYLQGDVYFYVVRKGGDIVDTCGGIYGQEQAEKEAKEFIDAESKAEKERIANMQQQLPI